MTRWNNPTYGYRSLTTLSRFGLGDRAAAHLVERYSPYLPGIRTTLPLALQGPLRRPAAGVLGQPRRPEAEKGEKNPAQPDDETGSHGWGATPLLWLHESLLGVTIARPAAERSASPPTPPACPMSPGIPAPRKAWSGCTGIPAANLLELEIPAGVEAEVLVPRDREGKRMVVDSAEGKVTPTGAGRYMFEISGAGRYAFRVW